MFCWGLITGATHVVYSFNTYALPMLMLLDLTGRQKKNAMYAHAVRTNTLAARPEIKQALQSSGKRRSSEERHLARSEQGAPTADHTAPSRHTHTHKLLHTKIHSHTRTCCTQRYSIYSASDKTHVLGWMCRDQRQHTSSRHLYQIHR